jgi:hypothetical protein
MIMNDDDDEFMDDYLVNLDANLLMNAYIVSNYNIRKIKLLLENSDIDSYHLRQAVSCKNIEIIKLLLNSDQIDPSYNDNSALKQAIYNSSVEIVKILLNSGRIDISKGNPLNHAVGVGEYKIVELLLQDPHIKVTDVSLKIAYKRKNLQILRALLHDPSSWSLRSVGPYINYIFMERSLVMLLDFFEELNDIIFEYLFKRS